jgi:hypothetical protein
MGRQPGQAAFPPGPVHLGGGGIDPVMHDDQVGAADPRGERDRHRLSRASPSQRHAWTIRSGKALVSGFP